MRQLAPEDAELDHLWRARYGQPMPLSGCADLVREVLRALSEPSGSDEAEPACS